MKKNRIKLAAPDISRHELEALVGSIALDTTALQMRTAAREAEILEINERFASELSMLQGRIAESGAAVQRWAEMHPEEFPKGKKSLEFAGGVIGFRTGTPKLIQIKDWARTMRDGWEKSVRALLALGLTPFVAIERSVAKDKILAAYSEDGRPGKKVSPSMLRRVGLQVVQEEGFFIEPAVTVVQAEIRKPSEREREVAA